jgi:Tol biopolymer transport system component
MSKSSARIRRFLWLAAAFVVTSSACVCGLGGRQSPSTNLPVWSPDGNQIAYIACEKECTIYRVNADGSGLTQLTTDEVVFWPPAWSPDGLQIVFVSCRDSRQGDLFIMNADGSDLVKLAGE